MANSKDGFDAVVVVDGEELEGFLEELIHAADDASRKISFAIDGGQLKYKVDEYAWSQGAGHLKE